MKIIADSSSLYSSKEAKEKGFTILPVSITMNGKSYKDYDEILPDALLSFMMQGAIPKSSQPAIGEILEAYTSADEDILVLNKPSDMPIHPSLNNYENTLANAVAYYYDIQNIPFFRHIIIYCIYCFFILFSS